MDLIERCFEINAHTGICWDEFFHASEASARVDDLPVSISAVLMAACTSVWNHRIRSNVPGTDPTPAELDKSELSGGLKLSTALMPDWLDFQANAATGTQIWGGGEVASADGMRLLRQSEQSMPTGTAPLW
ncbi:hypothetical protein ACKU3I_029030 [Serratia marcescens]